MGIFKSRSNKKFDYTPRYYNNDGDGSPYKMEQKFTKFRTTSGPSGGLKGKFKRAMSDFKNPDRAVNQRLVIITAILILIFLFIIDFDLSIFFKK